MLLRLEIPYQKTGSYSFIESRVIIVPIVLYQEFIRDRQMVQQWRFYLPYVPIDDSSHDEGTVIGGCYTPHDQTLLIDWIQEGSSEEQKLRGVVGSVVEGFPAIAN